MSSKTEDAIAEAASKCSVCGAAMAPEASRCEACGATRGQQHRCPFCRVIAEPEPHKTLRFSCPACGAPRVLVRTDELMLSTKVVDQLRQVRSARASRMAWLAASVTTGIFGVIGALILLGVAIVAEPPLGALLAAVLITAVPWAFSVLGWVSAKRRAQQMHESLEAAWLQAVKELAAVRASVSAADVAKAFGVDEQLASSMVTRLAAQSDVSTLVTDTGELAIAGHATGRLRVASEPKPIAQTASDELHEDEAELPKPSDKVQA